MVILLVVTLAEVLKLALIIYIFHVFTVHACVLTHNKLLFFLIDGTIDNITYNDSIYDLTIYIDNSHEAAY